MKLSIGHIALLLFAFFSCSKSPNEIEKESQDVNLVTKKTFDPELYFKKFGIEDGLISNELLNIYNDNKGFTWIATGKGIVKYDGYEFKNYFSDLEKNIHLEGPSYFYEDKKGTFWVFSGNGYLHSYDPFRDEFTPKKTKLENGWSTENPLRILEEANGDFWLGGYGGLQYLNKNTDSISLYPISKIRTLDWPHKEKVRFEVIQKDKTGNLWAGTRKFGLVKFNIETKKYDFLRDQSLYSNMLNDWITDIIPADSSNFWIADYNVGLIKFNPQSESIIEILPFASQAANKEVIYIRDVVKEGELLILATEKSGILVYDTVAKKVLKHYTTPSDENLQSNLIKRIVLDKRANLWAIGEKLQVGSSKYYDFEKIELPSEINDKTVFDLSSSASGDLIVSTPRFTVFYDHELKLSKAFSFLKKQGNRNYGVIATKSGSYYTSDEDFITEFDPKSDKIKKTYATGLAVDTVGNKLRRANVFFEDSQGTIWTIDNWARLKFIYPSSGKYGNVFALAQDPITEKFISVLSIIDDPKNSQIMVGTDNGLATVSYQNHEVNWLPMQSQKTDLSQSSYSYLYQDSDETIWSIIGGTLYTLNITTGEAIKQEQVKESVKWIVEEPKGTLWLNTNIGVIRINKESNAFTRFENKNFSEGSQNQPSPVSVAAGKIYFGGENGVTLIDPSKLLNSSTEPDIYLTAFTYPFKSVEGKVFDSTVNIVNQKDIELDYYQNDFTFSYIGINYKNPKLTFYSFFLEGYDTDWINVNNQRDAIYTNISPGKYTFWLKAVTNDGVWSKHPISFDIIINPPWWKTWWAYFMYLILLLGAIFGWIKFQVYQKTLKYKTNERLRTKISADLHDEVGSILSGLAMKSELMSYTANDRERVELSLISEMSRDAMERMRDTVWAIDSRKDNYENLIDRMKEFSEKNLSLKQIDYKFITENLDLSAFISPEKRQNTYLIFKEAITNILKHSDARNVVVCIATNNNQFLLNLKDDGNLQNGYESTGQGTSNMKMRAENMGGNLEMSYEDGFQINLAYPLN